MKILICSIIRNAENKLNSWYNQIKNIVSLNKDIDFYLSVYENNSTDNTKLLLNNFDFSFLVDKLIISEDLENYKKFYKGGYDPYSEESKDRVMKLSECRNKSLLGGNFYKVCDYVLFIEPDIIYNPDIIRKLIDKSIELNIDIITPVSINSDGTHFDKWGTRFNKGDKWGDLTPKLRNNVSLIDVHGTFNCMALYKSKPIIDGCIFGYMSDVLNSHDCDTIIICENFRKEGYGNIKIDCGIRVAHFF